MPGRYRSDTLEQRISIERLEQAVNIFGSFDENIRLLEQEFSVTVVNRDGELRVEGEPEDTMLACKAIQALLTLSSRGEAIGEQNVRYVIGLVRSGKESQITELTGDVLCISAKGRPIKPKTIGQKEYIKSVLKNTVTIGVGPAGTGKTYLAVAAAVQAHSDSASKTTSSSATIFFIIFLPWGGPGVPAPDQSSRLCRTDYTASAV